MAYVISYMNNSIAGTEGNFGIKNAGFYFVIRSAIIYDTEATWIYKCRNYALRVFCARGVAEGYKTHSGHNFYSILQQKTHFECLQRSSGYLSYK